jgi:hypothetical protein
VAGRVVKLSTHVAGKEKRLEGETCSLRRGSLLENESLAH